MASMVLACNHLHKNRNLTDINTLPSFKALLPDSSTLLSSNNFPSGKPIILFYFRPDCPQCNEETKILLDNVNSLNNVQIYFLSPMGLNKIRNFCKTYHLESYRNIIVAKDYELSFYRLFTPATVPYMAIYNSQKKLVKVYSEKPIISAIFEAVKM